MGMEWQVASKELSQKLCELGVEQKSIWWWASFHHKDWEGEKRYKPIRKGDSSEYDCGVKYEVSAFTCAELGEKLARYSEMDDFGLPKYDVFKWYWKDIVADTEADCRAKQYIRLLEQGTINNKVR